MPDQQDDARGDDLTQAPNGLDAVARTCRAIIETPEGRRSKYDYDPESGLFRLHSLLPEGLTFPLDFGFIPSTRTEDGAPLDIMVFTDEPSPVGALIDTRIVGVIAAEQDGDQGRIRSDRIIGVAQVSHLYQSVQAVDDLGQAYVENLTRFWVTKGELEGKDLRVLGVHGPDEAVERVRRAAEAAS
jgi:inorganic pyrophosphatase